MNKMIFRTACVSALFAAAFSFSAFAETITSVSFDAVYDDTGACSTTPTDPEFQCEENDLYDMSWELTSSDESTSYKTARSYKLTFTAQGDNTFAKADSVNVTGTGVESIGSKSTKDSGSYLEVKVKAYPYVQMQEPSIESEDESKIVIDKNGAGTIEYVLTYTDFSGDSHTVHSTKTGSSINVSSYNKAYSGSDEDKQDKTVTGFACRAIKPSSSSNPFIVPSNWTGECADSDFEFEDYETWGDYITNNSAKKANSGASTTSTITATTTSSTASTASAAGWSGSGNDWYYKKNGSNATGWVADGGNWYYCDPSANGKMKAGWVQTDGNWYYLNEAHDGTYGRMLTSWQTINGVTYYFRPNDGGPKGSMVTGTVKINGVQYTFDGNGALVK